MGEGYSVIPSSTRRENLASNLLALDLHLDAEDRAAIAALDCNDRLVSPEGLAPAWDLLPDPLYLYPSFTAPAGAVLIYSLKKSINARMRVLTARSL